MKEVKVNRDQLLVVLRKNKEEHAKVFNEAVAGYKDTVIQKLETALADARAGKRVMEGFHIPLPVNQTHEYNRAIKMMEMSTEAEITLTTQEFDAYVMDRWHWKQQFLHSNSAYSQTAAVMAMQEADEA